MKNSDRFLGVPVLLLFVWGISGMLMAYLIQKDCTTQGYSARTFTSIACSVALPPNPEP